MSEELTGIMTVNKVMYFSNNNFAIVLGTTEKTAKSGGMTFKGTFPEYPERGQTFCVKGTIEKDNKRQDSNGQPSKFFKVTFARPQEINSEAGWIEYLIKECPRVSEIRATELVNAFGVHVIEKLAESADTIMAAKSTVMKVPIRKEEADKIHAWAKAELRLSKMKGWLYEKNLTYSVVGKIVGKYGKQAPQVVRNNPYQLTEIDGIGFLTADKIAKAVKIPNDSPARIQAGILHTMNHELEGGGHTCITEHNLLEAVCKLLGVHQELVKAGIKELLSSGKLANEATDVKSVSQFPFLFDEGFMNV